MRLADLITQEDLLKYAEGEEAKGEEGGTRAATSALTDPKMLAFRTYAQAWGDTIESAKGSPSGPSVFSGMMAAFATIDAILAQKYSDPTDPEVKL